MAMRAWVFVCTWTLIFLFVETCVSQGLCGSSLSTDGGCWFSCPNGDGDNLSATGATISLTAVFVGNPIEGIPRCDIWVFDCDPLRDMVLCGGHRSVNADSVTDADGKTTISGKVASGGCADGIIVVVQGWVVPDPVCATDMCLPISVRTPDLNGSNVVDLADLALFATMFPPNPYGMCADLNCDGAVGLGDLARFAFHFGPPGHECGSISCP